MQLELEPECGARFFTIATSDPPATATPTSACFKAGASFTTANIVSHCLYNTNIKNKTRLRRQSQQLCSQRPGKREQFAISVGGSYEQRQSRRTVRSKM